jgi:hypothetical protein
MIRLRLRAQDCIENRPTNAVQGVLSLQCALPRICVINARTELNLMSLAKATASDLGHLRILDGVIWRPWPYQPKL